MSSRKAAAWAGSIIVPSFQGRDNRIAAAEMLQTMGMDKKVLDGKLRFVLAKGIGIAEVRDDVAEPTVAETLAVFCS